MDGIKKFIVDFYLKYDHLPRKEYVNVFLLTLAVFLTLVLQGSSFLLFLWIVLSGAVVLTRTFYLIDNGK